MSSATQICYEGTVQCSESIVNKGLCKNAGRWYNEDQGHFVYVCGVHKRRLKGAPQAMPKMSQNQKDSYDIVRMREHERSVEEARVSRCAQGLKGRILFGKIRMRHNIELIGGVRDIYPNLHDENRITGFGCSSLSPRFARLIDHKQPGLCPTAQLETLHQQSKMFLWEDQPTFDINQKIKFADPTPYRHKLPAPPTTSSLSPISPLCSVAPSLSEISVSDPKTWRYSVYKESSQTFLLDTVCARQIYGNIYADQLAEQEDVRASSYFEESSSDDASPITKKFKANMYNARQQVRGLNKYQRDVLQTTPESPEAMLTDIQLLRKWIDEGYTLRICGYDSPESAEGYDPLVAWFVPMKAFGHEACLKQYLDGDTDDHPAPWRIFRSLQIPAVPSLADVSPPCAMVQSHTTGVWSIVKP